MKKESKMLIIWVVCHRLERIE